MTKPQVQIVWTIKFSRNLQQKYLKLFAHFSLIPWILVLFQPHGKMLTFLPFPKKADLSLLTSYRPVSLLNAESKVFECLVFKHLFNHLRINKILTPLQSGFIPGDSTVNQLTFLYNTFCGTLDDGKEIRVVFCDIKKAFDRVWHALLLHTLNACGV